MYTCLADVNNENLVCDGTFSTKLRAVLLYFYIIMEFTRLYKFIYKVLWVQ